MEVYSSDDLVRLVHDVAPNYHVEVRKMSRARHEMLLARPKTGPGETGYGTRTLGARNRGPMELTAENDESVSAQYQRVAVCAHEERQRKGAEAGSFLWFVLWRFG
jgi:hypothetical protein